MIQQTEIVQIRITSDIKHYLEVIQVKYRIKKSQFISII
jgi:hypothetical protein